MIPFSLFPFPFSLGIVRGLRREGEIVFTYLLLAAGLFHPLAVEIFEIQKKARYLFRISKKTPRSISYGDWLNGFTPSDFSLSFDGTVSLVMR